MNLMSINLKDEVLVKVLTKVLKIGSRKIWEKEISDALEAWAEEKESPEINNRISCNKKGHIISREVCLNRRASKKRGCSSCKTGRLLQKIHDLEKELKESQ